MSFASIIYIPLCVPAPLSSLGFVKRFLVRLRVCTHPLIPNPAPGAGTFNAIIDRGQGPKLITSPDGVDWTPRPAI